MYREFWGLYRQLSEQVENKYFQEALEPAFNKYIV